ncbi:MAG TPA: DegV family protein [Candidatus Olsenella excrementavium]|uniref:DegV family protein n=1 Tax=Candidatus Olsenella excrementavium TaxID=2838709 RepID=A0A9D1Z9C6_9ACTN|nr:DegV family protein [Candidatus Olsenella excrementavium]
MAEKDFAIVCDATSDLPLSFLEKARVEFVRLPPAHGSGPTAATALERTYRTLARQGFSRVVSVHSSASFSPAVDEARHAAAACADVVDVRIVASGSASAATGMLIDRAARYRHFDVAFEDAVAGLGELASHVRLLAIPAPSSRLVVRRPRRTRAGLIGRAAATLRVRMTGERGLYLLSQGNVTQLARNNDLDELTHRLAHAVSTVCANEGQLVHALTASKNVRGLRAVERAIGKSGVDSTCLGAVRATALTEGVLGTGAVAVAIAPRSAYWRDEATLEGLGSQDGTSESSDAHNRRIGEH